ncbi:MAG: zinc transporter ZntB [Woeseiaceae bacterium]|nr:zinc transporter ZntB [Woeseiaceae bacterium]
MATERMYRFALLLDGRGGARELSDAEVASWQPADGLLWLDVDSTTKSAREWLVNKSGLPDGVSTILLATETRPRTLVEGDGLVIVLRGINMNPGAAADDMIAVRAWVDATRIITSRRRKIFSVHDVHDSLLQGRGPSTPGEFLVQLSHFLMQRIEAAIEKLEQKIDKLESELDQGEVEDVRSTLSSLRRHAAALARHLSPQRDALERLARSGSALLSPNELFDFREVGEHLTRHIEDLDLVRETALVLQEELLNRVAQEQNARMYLLSVVAAIFLPLTFVTGLLGMNVAGLPGTVNPNAFVIAAIVMALLGVALVALFRWKRWL